MTSDVLDIQQKNHHTMPIIEIENKELRIAIIPDLGGKMVKLQNKRSGTQFLKEPMIDYQLFSKPHYGDKFLPPNAAGFDECFPTISPSTYDYKGEEIQFPDHGELWSKPWKYEERGNGITLWTYGERLNYRFAKHIEINGNTLLFTYELESLEEIPFDYIWSAHPLLNIEEGDELLLPKEITEVNLNSSSNSLIADNRNRLPWPKILGNNSNIDFNYVQPKSSIFAAKLFTNRLTDGNAGIYRKGCNETLLYTFDTEQIPYLGIWLCYGGWPEQTKDQDYTLALEPCSARTDSLSEACRWNEEQTIAPLHLKCWQFEISIHDGKQSL